MKFGIALGVKDSSLIFFADYIFLLDAKNYHFGKEKREKNKATLTAEMTNENGGIP
jgi:hypothetical protein